MYPEKEIQLRELEGMLVEMWEKVLKVDGIDTEEDFFELGGDSIAVARFTNMLQERLGEVVHRNVPYEYPTISRLAEYLADSYRDGVALVFGRHIIKLNEPTVSRLTEKDVSYFREQISARDACSDLKQREGSGRRKNPQAVFILCTPRSGSTLLRIMLAGHPRLFAPPELHLLPFDSLKQRKELLSGYRRPFWSEGVIRAIMEGKHCDVDQAKEVFEECEEKDLTVQEFYALMQGWLDGRRLVDKTPSYAQNMDVLQRAEDCFGNSQYIHLLRHPVAMIKSYEQRRIQQFWGENLGYASRELAELCWIISHQNIIKFLENIPAERQCRVVFEDLVRGPRKIMEDVCETLKLELDEEVLTPYQNQETKMTDGPLPESKMLGDPKFHSYTNIDPDVADSWKDMERPIILADMTRRLAEDLGYQSGLSSNGN